MRPNPLPLPALLALALSLAPIATVASAASAPAALARPVERTLDNGLRVLVLPRPRLPIVQVLLLVPGGAAADPAGQEGVAMLTAQMLRRGTTSRTADGFAAAVDRIGGTIAAQASRDCSTLSGSFLARDLEAGLELMSNAALDPIFPEEEFQRSRAQSLRTLMQSRSMPATLADDQAWALALPGHPYGRPVFGTPGSLGDLTRESLRAYHRDVWRPDHAVLAIVGDVTPERAVALAADWFGRWAGRAAPQARPPEMAPLAQPRLALVDLPGMGWAEVRLALVLPARRAGGEAVSLAASAFAMGPDSRLGRLRGGVGGGAPRGNASISRDGGLLVVSLAVPVDSAVTAVRRLRDELRAFVTSPPAEPELAPLRHMLTASFPLLFESMGGALSQWQSATLGGQSADALVATPDRLAAVTPDAVADAAKRWFDPGHALVVVAGPAERLRAGLESLGPVENRTIEEALPLAVADSDTLVTPTPERIARGRARVARALEAHGGLARLRGIRDSEVKYDLMLTSGGRELHGELHQVRLEPYRLLSISRYLSVETRQVLDGTTGWSRDEADTLGTPLDSLSVLGLRAAFASDLPHLMLAAADGQASVVDCGSGRAGDIETDDVQVITASGERRRYRFDRATGRLAGMDLYETAGLQVPELSRRTYTDMRSEDGVWWPYREERRASGDNMMRLDVKSLRLNQGVAGVTFIRPAPRR